MKIFTVSENDRFRLSSTSKGNQIKWVNGGKFLKADTMGYESIAEVLASEVESVVNGINYVNYSLCLIQEGDLPVKYGCVSDLFTEQDESVITMDRILTRYAGSDNSKKLLLKDLNGKELISKIVNICSQMISIPFDDIMLYLSNIIKLDSIILNEDRHTNNISFIQCSNGSYRSAPVFDNGLSFLSDIQYYPFYTDLNTLMKRVCSKSFSTSFERQLDYFSDYPLLQIDCYKLFDRLDTYTVEFKKKEFERSVSVLKHRLKLLKGVAWDNV